MSRLLGGDVGSGKTAVAITASFLAISAGYQTAYMAPTEILVKQHFQSFIEYFSELKFIPKIGLITSSGCFKYPSKLVERSDKNFQSPTLEVGGKWRNTNTDRHTFFDSRQSKIFH